MNGEYNGLSWEMCQKYIDALPGYEHTKLVEASDVMNDDKKYYTYIFGEETQDRPFGRLVQTKRGEDGKLRVTIRKKLCHGLENAPSGSGKTQGVILNTAFNADPRMSYVFLDPKGEITKASYSRLVELYGIENVIVANFIEPRQSMVRFNFFTKLAYKLLQARSKKDKEECFELIESEIRKITDILYVSVSTKDPTWENFARKLILAVILGLFEDLTITESEIKKTRRQKVLPEMINFETIAKIINSFKWERSFHDNGFFTKRKQESRAYQLAKPVIENASTTRANYLGFVNDFVNKYSDPKIIEMSKYNTFNIMDITTVPKVLFLIYDMSDQLVREYVNMVIAKSIFDLREHTVRTTKPLDVPVIFMCDEFASLKANPIYPDIIANGRGSNIFLEIVIQSYSQLSARYPEEFASIKQNCDLEIFLGTNCLDTAERFAKEMGLTTTPDPIAFLNGQIMPITHPIVSQDYLMHKMEPQEAFIKINKEEPMHANFEFYYRTPEYTKYPTTDITSFSQIEEISKDKYDYVLPNMEEDDDLF